MTSTLGELSTSGPTVQTPAKRRPGRGGQILVAMLVGTVLGAVLGERAAALAPLGDLFIRLLVLVAIPLVFFNLLAGITSLTDLTTLGRLTAKILTLFLVTAVVAGVVGIAAMEVLRPGVGMSLRGEVGEVAAAPSIGQVLLDLVPTNIVRAFVDGNVVQILVFTVLLGVATLLLPEAPRDRLRGVFADLAQLLRRVVDIVLIVAPWGIGALMAVTVGRYGAELFGPMALFVIGVTAGHVVVLLFYMTLVRVLSTHRPLAFLKQTGRVSATAAATASSLASLSVALEVAEEMRLPRSIYSFVLPLGAQINKDGTVVLLAAVVVFTAQAAAMPLTGGDLITVVLLSILFAAGSGGIPGGGFVMALIMVQGFNLPLELAAIVGGIYRLVDIGNTTINVLGDMVGAVIVTDLERGRV